MDMYGKYFTFFLSFLSILPHVYLVIFRSLVDFGFGSISASTSFDFSLFETWWDRETDRESDWVAGKATQGSQSTRFLAQDEKEKKYK